MDRSEFPVGVFDSGVGGISVLREMVKYLPNEDFLFYGDSANAPYGTKSPQQIRHLTLAAVKSLREQGIKAVVIACNTATSMAIADIRSAYTDMPVIGIEPALKPAVLMSAHPKVVVLATPATVKGGKFHTLLEKYGDDADVFPVACPGLMEFVEKGELEGPRVEALLHTFLDPVSDPKPDAIVLGCTHYPFLKDSIRKVAGEGPWIVDGSDGTARELKRRLEEENLRSHRIRDGHVTFEMSLPQEEKLARRLLEM